MVLSVSENKQRRIAAPSGFNLRPPCAQDGRSVHALIAACPPLDANSLYANLLQCSHFAETCVLAEGTPAAASGSPAISGFISSYLPPASPGTLFIWQVAIAPAARGHGLAKRMLLELLARPACRGVSCLQTSVTPSNQASWALFRSLAATLKAPVEERTLFDRDEHFGGAHESEMLVSIGPLVPRALSAA